MPPIVVNSIYWMGSRTDRVVRGIELAEAKPVVGHSRPVINRPGGVRQKRRKTVSGEGGTSVQSDCLAPHSRPLIAVFKDVAVYDCAVPDRHLIFVKADT